MQEVTKARGGLVAIINAKVVWQFQYKVPNHHQIRHNTNFCRFSRMTEIECSQFCRKLFNDTISIIFLDVKLFAEKFKLFTQGIASSSYKCPTLTLRRKRWRFCSSSRCLFFPSHATNRNSNWWCDRLICLNEQNVIGRLSPTKTSFYHSKSLC